MEIRYSQNQLFQLSCDLLEKTEELFQFFHIDCIKDSKMWIGTCPIHDGDNTTAFNLYYKDHCGNWKCRTRMCEKQFQNGISIISLVRALLSKQNGWKSLKDKDKIVSFSSTVKFVENFLGNKVKNLKIDTKSIDKKKFSSIFSSTEKKVGVLTREQIRSKLTIPAHYYLQRNYSPKILDDYDVGLCENKNKSLYNRVVVPVYDNDYLYVGCTSRAIYSKCDSCGYYHSSSMACPSVQYRGIYTKWRHVNFEANSYLYNYWKAKNKISKSGIIIITESPGNVWRLEESGIFNSVGIFGTDLTERQKQIIDDSGAQTILLIMDNDKNGAGQNATKVIKEKCQKLYNIVTYTPLANDIGDMTNEQVKNEILPILEKLEDS